MRTGTCQDCGATTVGGERGVVPKRCPVCYKAHRRKYHQARDAVRPPRPQKKEHVVACSDCSIEFRWIGNGRPPTRCEACTKARRLAANRERGRLRRVAKKAGQPHRIGVCIECMAEFVGPARGSIPSRCPSCTEEWNKVRYKTNPNRDEAARRLHLQKKYGMTTEDWDRMYAEQDGRCAICKTHEDDMTWRLRVDHCHDTGKVRALLCHSCNTTLGHMQEDPELLRAAAAYLERYQMTLSR